MSSIAHILSLGLHPEFDFWDEVSGARPQNFKIHSFSLLKIHEWTGLPSSEQVGLVLVDLDDIAKTDPLDTWTLTAWRASLSDLVVRCTSPHGSPLLMGFSRKDSWDRAMLGLRIGVRDLVLPHEVLTRFTEIFDPTPALRASENLKDKKDFIDRATRFSSGTSSIFGRFPSRNHSQTCHSISDRGTRWHKFGRRSRAFSLIRKSAPLDTPILLRGPTGSGKELVAKALHRYSARTRGPFVAINCGAISPELVESELFGHIKGSFTDAHQDQTGLFAKANGGTLFLDEISELSLEVQVKLLRALQERQFYPVGSSDPVEMDVRIISATKEDVEDLCQKGRFRQDLLYRIKVMEIALPALAERRTDIPDLSKTILKKIARRHKRSPLEVTDGVLEKFLLYPWPGNIRQFENVLEHSATLAWAESRRTVELEDLPEEIRFATMSAENSQHLKEIVHRFEREYIASTVRRLGGSKEEAADILGLSLATLYRKLGS